MDFQNIITLFFGALLIAIPLIAIYACLTNRNLTLKQQILWIVLSLIVPFFGAFLYLILYYKKK